MCICWSKCISCGRNLCRICQMPGHMCKTMGRSDQPASVAAWMVGPAKQSGKAARRKTRRHNPKAWAKTATRPMRTCMGAARCTPITSIGWAAVVTGVFMVAEAGGGLLAGSLALLADAGHMLTDAASLALAWLAFRMAHRPADWQRTYGFHRFQVLAACAHRGDARQRSHCFGHQSRAAEALRCAPRHHRDRARDLC